MLQFSFGHAHARDAGALQDEGLSKTTRRRAHLYAIQHGCCAYCGEQMLPPTAEPTANTDPRCCTLEHVVAATDRDLAVVEQPPLLAVCSRCNHTRSCYEQEGIPWGALRN